MGHEVEALSWALLMQNKIYLDNNSLVEKQDEQLNLIKCEQFFKNFNIHIKESSEYWNNVFSHIFPLNTTVCVESNKCSDFIVEIRIGIT